MIISDTDIRSIEVNGHPVILRKVILRGPDAAIQYRPPGGTGLVVGTTVLCSCYVQAIDPTQPFFWTRAIAPGGHGHGPKTAGPTPQRVQWLGRVTGPDSIAMLDDPAIPLSALTERQPVTLAATGGRNTAIDLYIGGLQIEVETAGRQGIALIGDSTQQQASSGSNDSVDGTPPSRWLSAALNVPVFNRAISGQRTDQMLARWNRDIAPLAVNARYAIIQGGINDLIADVPVATIKSNLSAMVTRARASNLIPVLCTLTRNNGSNASRRAANTQMNDWIRDSGIRYIDLDRALADPLNPERLAPALTYDGKHYTMLGRMTAGLAMADRPFWGFVRPIAYRPPVA